MSLSFSVLKKKKYTSVLIFDQVRQTETKILNLISHSNLSQLNNRVTLRRKRKERERKKDRREKLTQQISSSMPPQHQIFLSFFPQRQGARTSIFPADHFPKDAKAREKQDHPEHRKWVTEQRQEGRDSHGHAQVARREDFPPRHGIAGVMLKHWTFFLLLNRGG